MSDQAMTGRLAARSDVRDESAAEVLRGALEEEPRVHRALVIGPQGAPMLAALADWATSRAYWTRLCEPDARAAPWPTDGPFDAVAIRLPRGKEALALVAHAAASQLEPGAPIYVVGSNDEGIRSADRVLAEVLDDVVTLDSRRHCRVFRGARSGTKPIRASLGAWELDAPHPLALPAPWITYPGLFAGGTLDEGTAELLRVMPKIYKPRRILDFGCGTGVISAKIAAESPDAEIDAIDADALAVEATRRNVPSAHVYVGNGLGTLGARTYHRIISNPPIHRGKNEHFGVLRELVEAAPRHLTPHGELWLVVQRQVPLQRLLDAHFKDVDCVKQTPRFHVWRAR